jgi:hypothetical protein
MVFFVVHYAQLLGAFKGFIPVLDLKNWWLLSIVFNADELQVRTQ